ncbi:MAG: hypothetical protein CSB48_09250 [Proteobacteria bacterium]|nr:MAG: hypothetical protein CSB48_09250 [Pseudomonadota bacterium]
MIRLSYSFIAFVAFWLLSFGTSATESLCAEVKIEISQELTLERQAFEAIMRITNTLDTFSLNNLQITIHFKDANGLPVVASSDPNHSSALFFIRLDGSAGVSTLSEGENGEITDGSIAPAEVGEIRWLIIPAQGAGGSDLSGQLYFVGAELDLTYGGQPRTFQVANDTIVVKPQPKLILDYFLTHEVNGDNPFTSVIEQVEPYSLGVRVANHGSGTAHKVKIDSAQPEIVENEKNLLVDFSIVGSFVDDQPATKTLLLDFGDIEGNRNRTGRWIMETSLTGRFVDINARVSHADELGGALTSLIDVVNTHLLVRDVRVDLAGRDNNLDFLAHDGVNNYKVYESDNLLTGAPGCEDCSAVTKLDGALGSETRVGNEARRMLSLTPVSGLSYIQVPDPYVGEKALTKVIRADGKVIPASNFWLSKSIKDDKIHFDYFVNVFDSHPQVSYTLVFGDNSVENQAPVIQFIQDKTAAEGGQVGFLVQASDPNNTIPVLSITNPPTGSTFTSANDGTATFHWFPQIGQAGNYLLSFEATDGQLKSTRNVKLTVNPDNDSDGDGMEDAWELEHFGNLTRDGTGDFDNDGISDLLEYLNGSNPLVAEAAPGTPEIVSPGYDDDVPAPLPTFVLTNAQHSGDMYVSYTIELFQDAGYSIMVGRVEAIPEGEATTTIPLRPEHLVSGGTLIDNQLYYWRAQALSQHATSDWVNSRFRLNTANQSPETPLILSPVEGAFVGSPHPVLSVKNSIDPDGDALTYGFTVFLASDTNLENPVAEVMGLPEGSNGTTSWSVPAELVSQEMYLWIAHVADEHGAVADSDPASFKVARLNESPTTPTLRLPANRAIVDSANVELVIENATDPEGAMLSYFFEIDETDAFNSPSLMSSEAIVQSDSRTRWPMTGLQDGTQYFWRVQASDGQNTSSWAYSQFQVSLDTSLPVPTLNNPAHNTWVEVTRPTLSAHPLSSGQVDLQYVFAVYTDESGVELVVQSAGVEKDDMVSWTLDRDLIEGQTYWWRVKVLGVNDQASAWSALQAFTVKLDNENDAPVFTFVEPTEDMTRFGGPLLLKWTDSDPDSSASIRLIANTTLIAEGLSEDGDGEQDQFEWDLDGLPDGEYVIKAIIRDEMSTITVTGITLTKNSPQVCDLNDDGLIDRVDINAILSRRNTLAIGENDPADANGDGVVTVVDGGLCVNQCTLLNCASQ